MAPVLLLIALASDPWDPVVLRLERLTNCGSWEVAVHKSGDARGELFNACHAGGPKKVTIRRSLSGRIPELRAMVDRERFTSLIERVDEAHPIVNDAACAIEISFKGSHRVVISGQQLASHEPELEAFRRIWRAVQALVPEPEW